MAALIVAGAAVRGLADCGREAGRACHSTLHSRSDLEADYACQHRRTMLDERTMSQSVFEKGIPEAVWRDSWGVGLVEDRHPWRGRNRVGAPMRPT